MAKLKAKNNSKSSMCDQVDNMLLGLDNIDNAALKKAREEMNLVKARKAMLQQQANLTKADAIKTEALTELRSAKARMKAALQTVKTIQAAEDTIR